jgi:uncharacterized protein YutE (UPF0331/DUF86 family)
VDTDVIRNKLESLVRCVERIESKRPAEKATLEGDLDLQDIIVVNLERAVQVCVDIGAHVLSDRDGGSPRSMSDVFRSLADVGLIESALAERLSRSVGFRNIAVHQYHSISWDVVYSIITKHLDDFRAFARSVEAIQEK